VELRRRRLRGRRRHRDSNRYRSGAPLLGQHNDELALWMQASPIEE